MNNFVILVAASLVAMLPLRTMADAKELAEQIVTRSGLNLGYDEESGTMVFIGTTSRSVADLSDTKAVMKIREEEAKIGMLKAKAEILKLLAREVSARSVANQFVSDGFSVSETSSVVDILSHMVLHGFQTICTAESYENGIFQTAVAIGWSEKSERAARAALAGGANDGTPPELAADSSPEWEAWAREQDLSTMAVSRSFEDSTGTRRYVGIGFSDVDGKTGKALKDARTIAFTKAKQNLLYAIHSDAEARTLAIQTMRTQSRPGEESETDTFRSSVRRLSLECRSMFLPNCAVPVYETTTHHPITGRRIYVCLAGVEPNDLPQIKPLK